MYNLFADIVEAELGTPVNKNGDFTISSPFRNDSNPSFRVYYPKQENDYGSAYDFGEGVAYTPISFIMKYKNISYGDTIEYIYTNYGVRLGGDVEHKDTNLNNKLKIILRYNQVDDKLMEKAICHYMKNDKMVLDSLIPNKLHL